MATTRLEEVAENLVGAMGIVASFLTPMLRHDRVHWGLTLAEAERPYPGDELVPEPRWHWTHGVYIDAGPEEVWPWVVQIGQDRGGFYSYELLENLAGSHIHNADRILPEFQDLVEGDLLKLHPKMPALKVEQVFPGRGFVVHGRADLDTGREWVEGAPKPERFVLVSWLFLVEPQSYGDCRVISRFRTDYSDDLLTRAEYGPAVTEPVGFVMDQRMLLGIKERVMAAKAQSAPQPEGAEADDPEAST